MRLMLAVAVLVGACGGDETVMTEPDASVDAISPDATPHPDNGFGNPCTPMYNQQHLYTECKSLDGYTGVCALDQTTAASDDYACRRFCSQGCQSGQVQVAGPENICWCEPSAMP